MGCRGSLVSSLLWIVLVCRCLPWTCVFLELLLLVKVDLHCD